MNFRPGVFDGAISISVLQWLCNADKKNHYPKKRLSTFFTKLFMCLTRGARAVFQFYPENDDQVQMIMSAAMHSGFTGGLVVDYPNSRKAKKYYLCLFAGASDQPLPAPIEDETRPHQVAYSSERMKLRSKRKNKVSVKDWVKNKKDIARSKGLKTANDSKYTARKRRPRF
jgi:18S rRNA (guanine1575-N7)-methyltransferase